MISGSKGIENHDSIEESQGNLDMALRASSLETISRKRRNTARYWALPMQGLEKDADDSAEGFTKIEVVV